ncbi:unnamed protein product [Allacma fusca]|uniref:Protein G12 n=1 Tax=Allacma fusca TaxID=39272 RepID=A0A8J2PI13_9HEXA|nr:unnamed protein product [Allacma fusca]
MILILLFSLAFATVQALPSEFSYEESFDTELINFGKDFSDLRATFLERQEVLSVPKVRDIVDRALQKYPELPSIVRGIRIFLTGPDAAPLFTALKKVIVPVVEALKILYREIELELEKAGEVLTEQGIRLFFYLQQPDVIQVVQKFQALPEVIALDKYAKEYGINILEGLSKLEDFLSSGNYIPTSNMIAGRF